MVPVKLLYLSPPPLRLPHTLTRSVSPLRMMLPKSVKTSNVLVVGGGPTGSVAAAHLHKRAISVTLIETQLDFTEFDATRAYCLRLDFRAARVLQQVEGMFEYMSHNVEAFRRTGISMLDASGINVRRETGRAFQGVPDLGDLRPSVSDSLKQFIVGLDGVDARYGVSIKDIQFANDGEMTVALESSDGQSTHKTRLLLACDGRNSQVARLLDRAHARGAPISAPHGLGVESFQSAAVGLALKSIVLNRHVVNQLVGARKEGVFTVRQLKGDPKRGFNDVFRITIFPASGKYTNRIGGFVGTIVRSGSHNLWKLGDVQTAYDFFQANFPQMDVRKAICEEEMRRFIEAKPSFLGDIRRRKSLAVLTGSGSNRGAVVFMGDSAHAFPPDNGQGVCAAIGDVGVFGQVLDGADEKDSLEKVMMRYDCARSDEGRALMRLSRFGSPYQYGVYVIRGKLWRMNMVMRMRLSKLLPGFFWPAMSAMVQEDVTYREIVRRADVTTWRILSGAAGLAVLGVAVFVRVKMG